MLVMMR